MLRRRIILQKNTFKQEQFAQLLDLAKGDRSINKYAEESNVSAAHISRFLRKMIKAPPSPETISKLSSKAYNEITYRDFMIAAGHIDPSSEKQLYDEDKEKKLYQLILKHLLKVDYEWNIKKPDKNNFFPTLIIDIDKEAYNKWLVEFLSYPQSYDESRIQVLGEKLYGKIAKLKLKPQDKFSILVDKETLYKEIVKNPPSSIRGNIYISLVDMENNAILKEEKISSYKTNSRKP